MESSQCVPSWDVDDPPSHLSSNLPLRHYHPSDEPLHPLSLSRGYEVAELTWENGHLALHGLVPPRIGRANPKNPPPSGAVAAAAAAEPWNKQQHRSGTLEAVVDQATGSALPGGGADVDVWFGGLRGGRPAAAAAAVDALVPCQDDAADRVPDPVEAGRTKRPRVACSSQGSAVGSLAGARVESTTLVTLGTCREDDDLTLTATATTASPETESTSLGMRKALALDDHISISQTSSHNKGDWTAKLDSLYDDEEKASRLEAEKASASTKRRRAAAVHNQSERKRRDRINQRMKTLQKLVPNSSKTDKASMLDEVIEYLKQLQAQIHMMSRMNNMMMPMAAVMAAPGQIPAVPMMAAHLAHMAQLQLPLPPPPQLAAMAVPGMLDLASFGARPPMPPSLPPMLHPSAFLALPTVAAAAAGAWDGSIPCQMPLPLSLEEYSRMAALFEQLYQQQPPPPPSSSHGKSS